MIRVHDVQDVAHTSRMMLDEAMAYCAQKMRLDGAQSVVERLKAEDGRVCSYCHYSVAKQVAEFLGTMDENIKATYLYDYDATPQDLCLGGGGHGLPIHLLVWAERKTAALKMMVETWDRALAQTYAEMIGGHPSAHVLDVQMVDNADVEKRVGYGALLSSLHFPPVQLWSR
ncbi:MAG TPA: hypothetical protein VLC52_08180 [Anaerolineae bacterium]|nr:hypothetical protein [Anaerolineae bacterium]